MLNSMTNKFYAVLLMVYALSFGAVAQDIQQTRQYPKDVFRYPLDLPPTTAGCFGELRSNHFHGGLDFKTNQRIGFPVHAVYDGFVSRLKIQFGGFGCAVYITHPNGYISVYGHLSKLIPQLAKIVHDYQYQLQTWECDIQLSPLQMPVGKGQVVAWSGNAGSSAGPHVHFELRDAVTQEAVNPQLFGLTIPDKVPPTLTAMYVYHLNSEPFSEKTTKDFLQVAGANGKYHLTKPGVITLSGETGFGITAYDVNSTSANHNGAYSIQLNVDEKPVYTFAVERFAFDQTHAINAHIDYPAYLTGGREIQKSFILPGNKIAIYPQSVNRGIVNFTDDAVHQLEYIVKDVMGNTATLKFSVRFKQPQAATVKPTGTLFKYDQQNVFNNDKVKVVIAPGNLYDDLYFDYAVLARRPGAYSATYRIHNRFTPIHDSYELWIKPDSTIGNYVNKAVIVSTTGGCEGGDYVDGYIKANARNFGDFYIKLDTIGPNLYPINIHDGASLAAAKTISVKISDNLSGIKSYNGNIDGHWVLMEYDYKTKVLIYTIDETIPPGKHVFNLSVSDNKNNLSQFTANFYR
jgi:hypothetical protein